MQIYGKKQYKQNIFIEKIKLFLYRFSSFLFVVLVFQCRPGFSQDLKAGTFIRTTRTGIYTRAHTQSKNVRNGVSTHKEGSWGPPHTQSKNVRIGISPTVEE